MMSSRKRVLFVAEAVTLAHVARAFSLARRMDPARYAVAIACDPRYDALFDGDPIPRIALGSISGAAFADALNRGAPLYQFDTLAAYAADDHRVIAAFAPDVVVGDFRLSLGVSARAARVPYVNVTNAGWSPHARPRYVVPDIGLVRAVGPRLGQLLFDLGRRPSFAMHAAPMNRLRREAGMPPLRDLRQVYADGDVTLYADLPELFPLTSAPASHRFIGPVLWSATPPAPAWTDGVPDDRPIVYVTLGSSGRQDLLDGIVQALADRPWTILAATMGRQPAGQRAPNVFLADVLDAGAWSRRARLVIGNGGSPSTYQALVHGVPVLGIPTNLDQYLNMTAVADAGAGLMLRSGRLDPAAVVAAADRLVGDPAFAATARRLGARAANFDAGAALMQACEDVAPRAVH